MTFSRFLQDGQAIEVLTPDTPAAWTNDLFNDAYFVSLNQCGQGAGQVIRPQRRPATGTYRYFFLQDKEAGTVWNPTQRPLYAPMDEYACVHHLAYSQFSAAAHDIACAITAFVPVSGCREIWTVTLKNKADRPRRLSLFTVIPFSDGGLMNANGWYDAASSIIYSYFFPYHTRYEEKEQVEHFNTLSYLFASCTPDSVDCNERAFFGGDDTHCFPAALRRGMCAGSICDAEKPVGAMQHSLSLAPGETTRIDFVIGFENAQATIVQLRDTLLREGAIDAERRAVEDHWMNQCASYRIETPNESLNRMMNFWIKKQIIFQSRLNRLCAVFPIRNQLQDYMGYALFDPAEALSWIRPKFAQQSKSGFLQQWHTEDGKESHGLCKLDFKDGGIWLVLCTLIAVHQNGSAEFLDERAPYRDDDTPVTLYAHLQAAIAYLAHHRGAHGLCLLGEGDWTDPINGPGRKGRGETTWSSCALAYAAAMMEEFAALRGDTDYVAYLQNLRAELKEAVNSYAWNGQWYATGLDDDGKPFGMPDEEEGRIFLNCQTWPILAGFADEVRIAAIYQAVANLETPCGPVLVWPAFSQWNPVWGRISLKLAGTSENGSVYCHASMFKAVADCMAGRPADALRTVLQTLPDNPENPAERNTQIPTYIPNYYFGLLNSPNFGQSSRHNRTGTASWFTWVVLEHLLGVRCTVHGLEIHPGLPEEWTDVRIDRRFRKALYRIRLRTGDTPGIHVNGAKHDGVRLPYEEDSEFDVDVVLEK